MGTLEIENLETPNLTIYQHSPLDVPRRCNSPTCLSVSMACFDLRLWVSKQLNIPYGQNTSGGWTPHDIRHTCLTNLALDGVPLHGIMEFAGHASITKPNVIRNSCLRKYRRLLSKLRYNFEVEIPQKGSHLSVVPKTGTHDQ
jgi:integrase